MSYTPIARVTAAQSVAQRLLEEIRAGAIRPGDQLPTEKELTQRFQVGRSSIREAIQILSTLSLVEARSGSGTFVKAPNVQAILRPELIGVLITNSLAFELVEARQMIEPMAVRLACLRATTEDLDGIDAMLDQHERALEAGQPVNEYAARFHVLLAEASHNRIASRFMESIIGLLMARGRKIDRIPGYAKEEVEEHRQIVRLVRARDIAAAEAAISGHIIRSAQTYDAAPDPVPAETLASPGA